MIVRAALCPSPPLLAAGVAGQAAVLPELRDACQAAVEWLLAAAPDTVTVIGPATVTASWPPDSVPDLSMHAPAINRLAQLADAARHGADAPDPSTDNSNKLLAGGTSASRSPLLPPLPLALAIGAELLDAAGYAGPRILQSVAASASPDACHDLGIDLAADAPGGALLVLGDGSARRSAAAPGYLDERAEPFDAAVEQAVRDGDLSALSALDPNLARDLLAAGRPAWQVMAAALAATPQPTAPASAVTPAPATVVTPAPAAPATAPAAPATRATAPAAPATRATAPAAPAPATRATAPAATRATATRATATGAATPADLRALARPRTRILYSAAPFGVFYLVATIDPTVPK